MEIRQELPAEKRRIEQGKCLRVRGGLKVKKAFKNKKSLKGEGTSLRVREAIKDKGKSLKARKCSKTGKAFKGEEST